MTGNLLDSLRSHFGFEAFRPGQAEAIDHLLAGRHLLVIMPTGSGKSLIYQLAGLSFPGVTLVVSPLISLMKDQVDSLTRRGIPAVFINSTLSGEEQETRLQALADGVCRIAYVAPERLRSLRFQRAVRDLSISLLAVDEAHCISHWGHDFRPDYLYIATARRQMGSLVTVALTATATPRVQDEIVRLLELPAAERLVGGFDRPNLFFEVFPRRDTPDKLQALQTLLATLDSGAALIFTGTRHEAEEVAAFVREVCGLSALHYHAGLDPDPRTRIQEDFLRGKVAVIVATCAFGMGIDRPDVRLVVHFTLPGNLETYYQEAGRAGRDGQAARVVLLYAGSDQSLQERFIARSGVTSEDLRRLHQAVQSSGRPEVWETEEGLAQATGLSPVKVRVGLAQLELAGAAHYLGNDGWSMLLRPGKWEESAVRARAADAEQFRACRRHQLAAMIAYAESPGCRRRRLLEYFGEASPAPPSRCCDNCRARKPVVPLAREEPDETTSSTAFRGQRSGWRSLVTRLANWAGPWFRPRLSREVVEFLARTDPQLLEGPWGAGCTLGYYSRFSGLGAGRTLIGGLVHRWKYAGDGRALKYLVGALVKLCAEHPPLLDAEALVPVPPSTPRSLDPVASLAQALSEPLRRPVWPVLLKTRWTTPQKALRSLAEKRKNVAGAFALGADVRGRRLLLLDDVYDSGATLREAARVLHGAGVARLGVLTVVRTLNWQTE